LREVVESVYFPPSVARADGVDDARDVVLGAHSEVLKFEWPMAWNRSP
jgi:hypothetical protein